MEIIKTYIYISNKSNYTEKAERYIVEKRGRWREFGGRGSELQLPVKK